MKNFMILAACAATFYACSSNDVNTPDINENTTGLLSVSTSVLTQNSKGTKAPITGTQLPSGAKIGVFVFNDNTENAYDGGKNAAAAFNQEWTASGTGASQTWAATPFTLSVKHADVFAYYPWKTGETYGAIDVQAGYTDFLIGNHTGAYVNGANPSATIQLNHALSMISFTFKRDDSYPAEDAASLQGIYFSGLNQSATINVKTGTISEYTGTGDFFVQKHNGGDSYSDIASDEITKGGIGANNLYHALLLPQTETDKKNVVVTIDNIKYTVPLTINTGDTANKWEKGFHYTYNLTIKGTSGQGNQLVVSSVTVTEWQDGGSANPEI